MLCSQWALRMMTVGPCRRSATDGSPDGTTLHNIPPPSLFKASFLSLKVESTELWSNFLEDDDDVCEIFAILFLEEARWWWINISQSSWGSTCFLLPFSRRNYLCPDYRPSSPWKEFLIFFCWKLDVFSRREVRAEFPFLANNQDMSKKSSSSVSVHRQ